MSFKIGTLFVIYYVYLSVVYLRQATQFEYLGIIISMLSIFDHFCQSKIMRHENNKLSVTSTSGSQLRAIRQASTFYTESSRNLVRIVAQAVTGAVLPLTSTTSIITTT